MAAVDRVNSILGIPRKPIQLNGIMTD